MVKNLPSSARDAGSISRWGTKIPYTTTKPWYHSYWDHMVQGPHAATREAHVPQQKSCAQQRRPSVAKINLLKTKSFTLQKTALRKWKDVTEWEKIIAHHKTKDWYLETIKNSLISTVGSQQSKWKKWVKYLNYFTKEDIQMANKHVKRCLTSSVIRGMKIKTTVRYHPGSHVRIAKIKISDKNKC